MKSTKKACTWEVGMEVVKIFFGLDGYMEATRGEITKIDGDTIYFNDETGITYDKEGSEKENFFPGMRSEIVPLY